MAETPRPCPPDRAGRWSSRWLTLLAGLALTAYLHSPVTEVMEPTLDSSNYASYAYFTAHHFQYGAEVVPMYGPFGFMQPGTAYNGELFWARFAAQLAGSAALAALVLWFFRQAQKSRLRWLGLGLFLVLAPNIDDLPNELAILLAGLLLLQNPPRLALGAVTTLLAFLSLIKGTHLLLSVATLGVVVAYQGWQGAGRRAAGIAITYLVTFLGFWLLAGQQPDHIPAYLRGIAALSAGYNATMSIDEPAGVLGRGLLALLLLGAGLAWGLWSRRPRPTLIAAGLLFAGFTFVKWKHGFVRADGHIAIFHQYAAIAAVWWFLVAFVIHGDNPPRPTRTVALGLMVGGLLAGWWIDTPAFSPGHTLRLVTQWPARRIRTNLVQLRNPAAHQIALDARLANQRERHDLPLIREEVGDRPIDLFGVRHGIIPLNGLHYRPRPMGGGSFNVYNPYLMRLNQAFLRDPARRPPYYLMRFEPIDGRLGAQEDGLALLELIQRFHPVRLEEDYLLMRETAGSAATEPVLLARQILRFGQAVMVPAVAPDRLLVARFSLPPSLVGRLRRLLYKPPVVTITLQSEGLDQPLVRRLVPDMADSPFLLSPIVDTTADFARLYSRAAGRQARTFSLSTHVPAAFAEELQVEFHTLPRPPVARAPDVPELLSSNRAPLFNPPPESVETNHPRAIYQGKLQIQPLEAPGRITWRLDGTESDLVFDHGIRPEAYERGHGNGVLFVVELHPPDAPPQILFQRLVDPFTNPAERRTLTSRVLLPPHVAGSRLVLRADPGPQGDNAWDWSYVAQVQVRRLLADPDGRSIFNRAPVATEGNLPAPTEADGAPAVLLHVPAALTFPLQGAERHVRLQFGFLPGAYTGEGRTSGADFVLELRRPGQAPREIFRRTLRPVNEEADRGPQSATVTLPALAPGDQLVVRTRPVEGGGNSWGWTYFSRCAID